MLPFAQSSGGAYSLVFKNNSLTSRNNTNSNTSYNNTDINNYSNNSNNNNNNNIVDNNNNMTHNHELERFTYLRTGTCSNEKNILSPQLEPQHWTTKQPQANNESLSANTVICNNCNSKQNVANSNNNNNVKVGNGLFARLTQFSAHPDWMPNFIQTSPQGMPAMVALIPQSSPAPLIVNGINTSNNNNNSNNMNSNSNNTNNTVKQVNVKSDYAPYLHSNSTSDDTAGTSTAATISSSPSSSSSPYTNFFNRLYRGSSTASIQQANEKLIGAHITRPATINIADTRQISALSHQSSNFALMPQLNFTQQEFTSTDNSSSSSSSNNTYNVSNSISNSVNTSSSINSHNNEIDKVQYALLHSLVKNPYATSFIQNSKPINVNKQADSNHIENVVNQTLAEQNVHLINPSMTVTSDVKLPIQFKSDEMNKMPQQINKSVFTSGAITKQNSNNINSNNSNIKTKQSYAQIVKPFSLVNDTWNALSSVTLPSSVSIEEPQIPLPIDVDGPTPLVPAKPLWRDIPVSCVASKVAQRTAQQPSLLTSFAPAIISNKFLQQEQQPQSQEKVKQIEQEHFQSNTQVKTVALESTPVAPPHSIDFVDGDDDDDNNHNVNVYYKPDTNKVESNEHDEHKEYNHMISKIVTQDNVTNNLNSCRTVSVDAVQSAQSLSEGQKVNVPLTAIPVVQITTEYAKMQQEQQQQQEHEQQQLLQQQEPSPIVTVNDFYKTMFSDRDQNVNRHHHDVHEIEVSKPVKQTAKPMEFSTVFSTSLFDNSIDDEDKIDSDECEWEMDNLLEVVNNVLQSNTEDENMFAMWDDGKSFGDISPTNAPANSSFAAVNMEQEWKNVTSDTRNWFQGS